MACRLFLIAGESSGDMHGASLVKALKKRNAALEFRGLGGDRMQAEGMSLLKHYRETSFMGFVEVLFHIRKILSIIRACKREITAWKPDALILIDYPGFNLRIAEWAHKRGYRVFYYISPQIWAWKQGRVRKIKRSVDEMYCILPFELAFYQKFGMKVHYVGHPLMDSIEAFRAGRRLQKNIEERPKAIALLPGSRAQEVRRHLKLMLEAAGAFPDYKVLVAASSSVPAEVYNICGQYPSVEVLYDQSYDVLARADTAVVASGTASLEAALLRVPEVICYKGNPLSVTIARMLIKVPYISLVNLILNRPALKELIQKDCSVASMQESLRELLHDGEIRARIQHDYDDLEQHLGGAGASDNCAESLLACLNIYEG